MNCVGCKKKIPKGEFLTFNGGALVGNKTKASMGDKNLLAFLTINAHFDSKKDYRSITLANNVAKGQFEFYACSYDCLVDFLTQAVLHLKKLSEIKKFEIAPQSKLDKIEDEWIKKTLKIIGHPEAMITDESMVGDFFYPSNEAFRIRKIKALSKKFCFEIKKSDYIWHVAKKLKAHYKAFEKIK